MRAGSVQLLISTQLSRSVSMVELIVMLMLSNRKFLGEALQLLQLTLNRWSLIKVAFITTNLLTKSSIMQSAQQDGDLMNPLNKNIGLLEILGANIGASWVFSKLKQEATLLVLNQILYGPLHRLGLSIIFLVVKVVKDVMIPSIKIQV